MVWCYTQVSWLQIRLRNYRRPIRQLCLRAHVVYEEQFFNGDKLEAEFDMHWFCLLPRMVDGKTDEFQLVLMDESIRHEQAYTIFAWDHYDMSFRNISIGWEALLLFRDSVKNKTSITNSPNPLAKLERPNNAQVRRYRIHSTRGWIHSTRTSSAVLSAISRSS
jgi:hypothetical protein